MQNIIHAITSGKEEGNSTRLVVRGGGGLGKTTLALSLLHHEQIKLLFSTNTFFVSCESSHTSVLLLNGINRALGLPQSTSDPLQQLQVFLQTSNSPIFLVLDNFETPWFGEDQEKVRQILILLDSVSCLTLMLTTRASELPPGIKWTKPVLPVLTPFSLEAARATFADIAGEDVCCPALDTLLHSVDFVPLAVTLMASLALSGDSIRDLQRAWDKEKTSYLSSDGDSKNTNLETSIKISIQSGPMMRNPSALRLLSAICHLPEGGSRDHLEEYVSIPNPQSTARLLKAVSLIFEERSRLKVLSPIRAYVLSREEYSLHPDDKASLIRYYTNLMDQGGCWPGDGKFLQACQTLVPEQGNIHSIVSLALREGPPSVKLAQSIFIYSDFEYLTTPNSDILEQLIGIENWDRDLDSELEVRLIRQLGKTYTVLNRLGEGLEFLQRSLHLATKENLLLQEATCLRDIGNCYRHRGQHAEALQALGSAEKKYHEVGSEQAKELAAGCRHFMGTVKVSMGCPEGTLEYLEETVNLLESNFPNEQLNYAQALQNIAMCHAIRLEPVKAIPYAEQAHSLMQRLGYIQGEGTALWVLGTSLAQGDQREQAIILLKEALSLLARAGDRIMAARAYQSIGISYGMLGQRENFSDSFSKARFMFSELDMPEAEVDCLYNLASAEVNVIDPKSIDHFREARGLYLTQKRSREAARCLKSEALMRMLCKNTPHEQLLSMHKQAREELLATGDKGNAAWAMVNIGSQLQEIQDMDGARASFEIALKEFGEDGNAQAAVYVRGMLHMAISQPPSSPVAST